METYKEKVNKWLKNEKDNNGLLSLTLILNSNIKNKNISEEDLYKEIHLMNESIKNKNYTQIKDL